MSSAVTTEVAAPPPMEKLMTSTPSSVACSIASTESLVEQPSSSVVVGSGPDQHTLYAAMRASGATPDMVPRCGATGRGHRHVGVAGRRGSGVRAVGVAVARREVLAGDLRLGADPLCAEAVDVVAGRDDLRRAVGASNCAPVWQTPVKVLPSPFS